MNENDLTFRMTFRKRKVDPTSPFIAMNLDKGFKLVTNFIEVLSVQWQCSTAITITAPYIRETSCYMNAYFVLQLCQRIIQFC